MSDKRQLTKAELTVITDMNHILLGQSSSHVIEPSKEAVIAAKYYLHLLDKEWLSDGVYTPFSAKVPFEAVFNQGTEAFLRYTSSGKRFLYDLDEHLGETVTKKAAQKIYYSIRSIAFSRRESASLALRLLTGSEDVHTILPGAEGTWISDKRNPPVVEFERDITNYTLLPEALYYALDHSPFLKK